jgi:NAD(P)H-hydrate repair Nnr-like enzyme with NAD(P)H-hydrate epimerase domain
VTDERDEDEMFLKNYALLQQQATNAAALERKEEKVWVYGGGGGGGGGGVGAACDLWSSGWRTPAPSRPKPCSEKHSVFCSEAARLCVI